MFIIPNIIILFVFGCLNLTGFYIFIFKPILVFSSLCC